MIESENKSDWQEKIPSLERTFPNKILLLSPIIASPFSDTRYYASKLPFNLTKKKTHPILYLIDLVFQNEKKKLQNSLRF